MKMKIRHCLPACVAWTVQMAVLPAAHAANEMFRELSASVGQRKDNLAWNIAGNTVNVLSELKWENVAITQLQIAGKFYFADGRQLRTRLGYGVINSVTNQDSDYDGNNRTLEFSRSNNKTGGDVFDASIGMGKKFPLGSSDAGQSIYAIPFVGLSIHQQNLTMTDGVQTLPASGYFPGLASSYDAQWAGPWLGAEVLLETVQGWSMVGNAEYHWVNYSASANWNLRADFAHPVSFRHASTGEGILLSLGASYPVRKNMEIKFVLEHQRWTTGAGSDVVFFADGTVGYTRLNAVNWNSIACNFGITRNFTF